jgi:hypothetical protein
MASEFAGRAFTLAKVEGHRGHRSETDDAAYTVLIADADGDDHDDCTCPGYVYKPSPNGCKHIAAMRAVLANGWLDPVPAVEPAAPESLAEEATLRVWCSECDAIGVPGQFVPGRFQLCLNCIAAEKAALEAQPEPAAAVEPSPAQIAERIISVWNRIFEAEDAARKVAEQRRACLATMPARFAAETC